VHLGQHIDLFILFVQQVFEIADFGFQHANAFLERFGVSAGKSPPAELIAGATLKPNIGTLRARRSDSIASYLFASASVTGLGYPALRAGAHLDDLHR